MKAAGKLCLAAGGFLLTAVILTGCKKGEESGSAPAATTAGTVTNMEAGMQAVADRDYQTALTSFDAAIAGGEDKRLAIRGKGIAYIGMTDYLQAIDNLEECLSYGSGVITDIDYDINYYLAAAYGKSGEYEKAERAYSAILALRPNETDAYYLRGSMRLSMNLYDKAKEDFDKMISLEPHNYDRLIRVCEVLQDLGYKEAGQEYLNEALKEREAKMSSYDKGRIYYFLEDYQQAYLNLEEAKANGSAEVYLYLGKAYEATGDYNYAINNVYASYLSKNDGDARIYNQLGLCYMKQKDYEAALTAFQNAMAIEGNGIMQTLQFNEIVAYEYLGDYTKAQVLIDAYLKSYPDDEAAQRESGFLTTR